MIKENKKKVSITLSSKSINTINEIQSSSFSSRLEFLIARYNNLLVSNKSIKKENVELLKLNTELTENLEEIVSNKLVELLNVIIKDIEND